MDIKYRQLRQGWRGYVVNKMNIALPPTQELLITALEKQNIPIESQCRQGFCGACRCQLIRGEITYSTPPLAATVNDNDIFVCCASALTEIELSI